MLNNGPDTLFRLYVSAYVPMISCRDGFDRRQESDLDRHLAADVTRGRTSPFAIAIIVVLALIAIGSSELAGI